MTDANLPALVPPDVTSPDFFAEAEDFLRINGAKWRRLTDGVRANLGELFYNAAVRLNTKQYRQLVKIACDEWVLAPDTIGRYRLAWQKTQGLSSPTDASEGQRKRHIGEPESGRHAVSEVSVPGVAEASTAGETTESAGLAPSVHGAQCPDGQAEPGLPLGAAPDSATTAQWNVPTPTKAKFTDNGPLPAVPRTLVLPDFPTAADVLAVVNWLTARGSDYLAKVPAQALGDMRDAVLRAIRTYAPEAERGWPSQPSRPMTVRPRTTDGVNEPAKRDVTPMWKGKKN